ncbi:glycosyltransferase [[Clostridium] symbiosum]|uniref:glycosyltransferase n=1 Tax=Clostridium symbiosum TaxID=1512 RepID=UPI002F3E6E4B
MFRNSKKRYKNIKIKILGNGPTQEELKKITDSLSCDVEFLGYMSYKKMAAYLSKSDLTVNSVVKKSAASIITKIGDYLAAAKPMINTCSSHEFQNKVEHDRFGINVEAENVRALTDAIIYLYENKELCREFRKNARQVAERDFDRKNSYKEIVNLINDLIGEDKNAN